MRSVPAVTIWLSSGWYTALRKKVLANRLWRRLQAWRSQMMQEPSLLALTHSSSLQASDACCDNDSPAGSHMPYGGYAPKTGCAAQLAG